MLFTRKRIVLLVFMLAVIGILVRIFVLNLFIVKDEKSYSRLPGSPVLVMVFYEALCPDSKYFITKQLLPAYKTAASIMEVQLVPYGKAQTHISEEGHITFNCQHGASECEANIYHACAIESIEDPLQLIEVISCMIRDNRMPKEAMLKCAKQHNVDTIELIQKCYDSNHGAELLKLNGDATNSLRPPITFIPTITLDGSQGRQAAILKNLLSEVCRLCEETDRSKSICTNLLPH